jgi:hypothetical protein
MRNSLKKINEPAFLSLDLDPTTLTVEFGGDTNIE